MAKKSMTPLAQFKRSLREFGLQPRVHCELEGDYLRVSNLKIPTQPSKSLKEFIGEDWKSDAWVPRLGTRFGFKADGFDEDGNYCWIIQQQHIFS